MQVSTKYQRISEPKHPLIEEVYLRRWKNKKNRLFGLSRSRSINFRYIKPETIIDVACGCGISSYGYIQTFPESRLIGIDISEKAIEIAKRDYQSENLCFEVQDATDLEKYKEKADIVTCFSSMHEFENLEECLRQIYLTLKENGIFHFSDLNRNYIPTLNNDPMTFENTSYQIGDQFYQLRASLSDTDFIELLQDEKRLADFFGKKSFAENQWSLVRFSSYVAAYTPEEITKALETVGFHNIHWISYDKTVDFEGYSVKAK